MYFLQSTTTAAPSSQFTPTHIHTHTYTHASTCKCFFCRGKNIVYDHKHKWKRKQYTYNRGSLGMHTVHLCTALRTHIRILLLWCLHTHIHMPEYTCVRVFTNDLMSGTYTTLCLSIHALLWCLHTHTHAWIYMCVCMYECFDVGNLLFTTHGVVAVLR